MTNHPAGDAIARVRAMVATALRDPAGGATALARVCQACVELLPVDGASISVISGTEHRVTLYASDATIAAVDELQFTLGEGPCFDAFEHRRPVLVADLTTEAAPGWPVFAAEITTHPVAAIFAFPLQSGAANLGAMNLYRRTPGWLTVDELATALQLVDLATVALLLGYARGESDDDTAVTLPQRQAVVHQAAGMLIAEHGISAAHALVRLRGHAFGTGATVEQVAADLTSRRIHPADIDR